MRGGATLQTIFGVCDELGYDVSWKIYNSKNYGVPQNRERIFIKGYFRGKCGREVLCQSRDCEEVVGELSNTYYGVRNGRIHKPDEIMNTLSCQGHNGGGSQLIQLNNDKQHSQGERLYDANGIAVTINAAGNNNWYKINKVGSTNKVGNIYKGGQLGDVYDPNGLSPTECAGHSDSAIKIIQPVLTPDRKNKRQNGRRMKNNDEEMFTLTAQDQHGISDGYSIRKLTPVECERLQGFPDDWTKYGKDDELISDTQRYKCCGNAVTTNVITAIVNEMFEKVKE